MRPDAKEAWILASGRVKPKSGRVADTARFEHEIRRFAMA
jgi:hypothetical protein